MFLNSCEKFPHLLRRLRRPVAASSAVLAPTQFPDCVQRLRQQSENGRDKTQPHRECCGRWSRSSPELKYVSWLECDPARPGELEATAGRAKPHSTIALERQRAEHQCGQACLHGQEESLPNLSLP